jgi:poly(ribitol-phosphate) beta-N-acetylglucosaminyltransferase
MLVSVVVPTYNPGPYLDACIESLVNQTLPPTSFEIIVVDDGSTDDTPARLDAVARRHANVHVIRSSHSGWSGRPRNLGIQHARGEFVQFVDQDDRMARDALRRLVELGQRTNADIVLGKVVSDFRSVAIGVYAENRDRCTIHDSTVIDSLTPHKMFRRSFLAEHGMAFPEGQRRLDDQLFVVKAYFATKAIAILADEPCYFYLRRADRGNAGSMQMEPEGYFANLREVIGVVLANTEPGAERARLIRRFCRVELLGRLAGRRYVDWEPTYRDDIFSNVRAVFLDVVDAQVEAGLGIFVRVRADLVRADRPGALLELGRRALDLGAVARVEQAHWSAGRLRIGFTMEIKHGDGSPFYLERRGGRTFLERSLTSGILADPINVTDGLERVRVRTLLHERESNVEWDVPTKITVETIDAGANVDGWARVRILVRGVVTFDPETAAVGRQLVPGAWAFHLRLSAFGLDLRGQVGESGPSGDAIPRSVDSLPSLFHSPDRLATLRFASKESLWLEVARVDGRPRGSVVYDPLATGPRARIAASLTTAGRSVYRRLPIGLRVRSSNTYQALRATLRRY